MSDNVQATRRMLDAWDSGDLSGWAAGLHDDVTWIPLVENTQTEPIQGADATLAFVMDWIKPWEAYSIHELEIREAGDDQVVLSTRQVGRLPGGAEVAMDMHAVGTFHDGKLFEMRWFTHKPDALEAAGLAK